MEEAIWDDSVKILFQQMYGGNRSETLNANINLKQSSNLYCLGLASDRECWCNCWCKMVQVYSSPSANIISICKVIPIWAAGGRDPIPRGRRETSPIHGRLLVDPMRAPDGRHYERAVLQRALAEGHDFQVEDWQFDENEEDEDE